MSWNKPLISLLFISLLGCAAAQATGNEPCPKKDNTTLKFVDIFDGPPEELAILMPDVAHETSGKWSLGYVYDANRFVTVRCKYADGANIDVKIAERIKACNYKINTQKNLVLSCK